MKKLTDEKLQHAVVQVLGAAFQGNGHEVRCRNFTESVDLQVGLRGYDTRTDRRFAGTVALPYPARIGTRIAVIGDETDCAKASSIGVRSVAIETIRGMNRNKKLLRKFHHSAEHFLASETLIKQIPRLMGPSLGRAGKFPSPLRRDDNLELRVHELRCQVKFQLKKVVCLAVPVGHIDMSPDELRRNCLVAVNFLVSLLKKHWHNIKSLHLKSTMGQPVKLC
mmetsp:Transcript_36791/g.84739  ORF Transcript_36791/g.84739 Transcript_36791/m.84739 type:complete len:223 (-) Transcript_36791:143-811(-)